MNSIGGGGMEARSESRYEDLEVSREQRLGALLTGIPWSTWRARGLEAHSQRCCEEITVGDVLRQFDNPGRFGERRECDDDIRIYIYMGVQIGTFRD